MSLPTYYLSLFTIPQHVANKLERIQRNFLWGRFDEVFKYPLIAWDKVVWPVEAGGLRIRRIGLFNQALLGKWLWCFGKEVTHYGIRLLPPNMRRLVEVGALELFEEHMVVGCGRTLVSLVMWCMQLERVFVFSIGTTLGAVLFL